ncbi:hypothetical protein LguiB_004383 [Lonicera macranthoides]
MLEIHHGGKFVAGPLLHYKGGKVDYIYNVNPGLMSFEELKGILVFEYGYTNVTKIHYNPLGRSFTTLRLIVDDSTILAMLKDVHISGGIEIYNEHDFETNIKGGFEDDEKQGNVVEGSESTDGNSEDNNSDGDSASDCYSAPSVENVSDEELVEKNSGDGGVNVQKNSGDGGVNAQQNNGDSGLNVQQNSESSDEEEANAADGKKGYEFNSDCADSSDYDTPVEDEDWDIRRVKNFPMFDPKKKFGPNEKSCKKEKVVSTSTTCKGKDRASTATKCHKVNGSNGFNASKGKEKIDASSSDKGNPIVKEKMPKASRSFKVQEYE